ncbi:HAMP domain-containing protein [Geomonas terrae]|uniref:histidine kinase n=1 Tax=Geomonas terrae TaxID=2562681 RepID=A0A4S1CLM2_9BACT|nr:ATP-binding protein [Geomonas terrae]TGU74667.1 HAMP domain-containing protein [Geomonas terrae]
MQPRFGIRSKLLLSILAILLISYSTLIYSTMTTMSASLRSEIDRNLETYLTYARSQLSDRAKIVKYSLLQPATSRTVHEHMKDRDRAWLTDRLRGVHKVLPYLEFLVLLDADKRVIASLKDDQPDERLEVPGVVEQALVGKRVVISTEILSGALLCRTGVERYCDRGGESEAFVTTVAVPVLAEDGRVLGCMVAGEVLNDRPTLPDELQEVSGRDVEITITQRDLRIASSLPSTLRDSSTLEPEVIDVLERGEVYRGEAMIGARSFETVIDPILNSRGEFVGSLSVAVATERFKQNRRQNLENILAAAAVGILCSFGLAFLASRHLTRPLRELASSASRIEEGDFDQRVEGDQDDEVGMLASSFNQMVQALKERDAIINRKTSDLQELNEQLERMVDERTSALAMEMGRLEAVLTSLAEGVVVTDLDNKVVLFNPAAQQLFEMVPHRVVGKPIEQVCELVGFTPLLARIREFTQAGAGGCREELTVKGKRLHVYLSSLTDEKGNFAGIVFSIRDVTVEQQVDKMKTEFISTVSHELKTPLTSIKGSLQLLLTRSKWLTDTERQLLTVCFRNTQRLIRLIGEILDISGIESGGMVFKFKPVSIGELTVYAVEEIKSYAMGRDITIVNTVGEHLPMVYGDSDRLIQVLTNLLSNAVKFSPEGKVVMISAEQEGNYVVVSVADKGRVIQWSDRDRLFKKFQQIECQERGKVGGTGLGLAICKEIVERHHGRIFYTAAQERGNTFSFTVPIIGETDGKK